MPYFKSHACQNGYNYHLVKVSHGLVSATDLHLIKGGLDSVAATSGALDGRLVGVLPGAGSAEDIVALLPLEHAAREQGRLDGALVGAGTALEAVTAAVGRRGHRQDVATMRADYI